MTQQAIRKSRYQHVFRFFVKLFYFRTFSLLDSCILIVCDARAQYKFVSKRCHFKHNNNNNYYNNNNNTDMIPGTYVNNDLTHLEIKN